MNAALQLTALRPPEDPSRAPAETSGRRDSLQRALHTLRAIRERYEAGRNAHPEARCYSVQVAVGHGDMAWISLAIELLQDAQRASPEACLTYLTERQMPAPFDSMGPAEARVSVAG